MSFTDSPASSSRGGGDGADSKTTDQISQAAKSAKNQVISAAEPLKEQARSFAEEQKQDGAGRIDEVARAVHSAADEIGKQIPQAAGYIHSGADRLEDASRLLRDNSVDELVKINYPLRP